jgi:hypothetical protein
MRGVKLDLDLGVESTRLRLSRFPRRAARTDVVTIPVTDAIHQTLQSVARSKGIPLAQWARAVLLRAAAEAHQDSHFLAP